jgi:DNA-binding winged helix-turn-helix (wHTH) protein
MSNVATSQSFYAWQIHGLGAGHCGDYLSGPFRAAPQSLALPCPIMRLSMELYDLDVGVRPAEQPLQPQVAIELPTASNFLFGSFRLIPTQRLLLKGNEPVSIGSRAMDLLIALVEQAGEVLTKQELTKRAWPGLIVEEDNLKVQICALRRALGDRKAGERYINTVQGLGYAFVKHVTRRDEPLDNVEPD